jgi:choline dehydrogenase
MLTSSSSSDAVAENPTMSWEFFVDHYEDTEQAYRDSKYTWRTVDNDYYVGLNPPEGAEPLGILYPRAGTLGGCGNHNAMNLALPPDENWDYIANLTGDASWSAETMRGYFEQIENNHYISSNGSGTEGHGFDGWLAVRYLLRASTCAVYGTDRI